MSQAGPLHVVGGGGGSDIMTITGNDGVPESPIGNNFTFLTAHSTVKFRGSPGTETLDFGLQNLFLGSSAPSLTIGTNNTFLGIAAGNGVTSTSLNVGIGTDALVSLTSNGAANGENTAIGYVCLASLMNGTNNIGIGSLTGQNYTSNESNNILINHSGVIGESNTIRIGTAGSTLGEQDRAFLAGVTGVTVAASSVVGVDASGQLNDLGFGTAGNVLTSNGAGNSPTWQPGGGGLTAVNWSVQLSANQTNVTGNNTQYQIPYDSVLFDSASGYNAGTFLYTIPDTGVYMIIVNNFLFGGSVASTLFFSWLSVNGAAFPGIRIVDTNSASLGLAANGEFILSSSYVGAFTAGDTIGIFVDVIGGVSNDVGAGGGSGVGCLFSGFRVA